MAEEITRGDTYWTFSFGGSELLVQVATLLLCKSCAFVFYFFAKYAAIGSFVALLRTKCVYNRYCNTATLVKDRRSASCVYFVVVVLFSRRFAGEVKRGMSALGGGEASLECAGLSRLLRHWCVAARRECTR